MKKNDPKIINAWCMYDWANSVHALVIVSSIFPVYFSAAALNASAGTGLIDFFCFSIKSTVLFSYTVSASFLLTALLIPLCTAIADFTGNKKRFMKFFCYLGSISCMLLF
ncbi:MAG: MFS transporter, partial [Dyadobacter sp.]